MKIGYHVNPLSIQPGDKIAVRHRPITNSTSEVTKTREVKRVTACGTSPESIHLDHECYDSRFSTVIQVS